MNTLKLINADFKRYIATGANNKLKILFFIQGFIFTTVFRIIAGYIQLSIECQLSINYVGCIA